MGARLVGLGLVVVGLGVKWVLFGTAAEILGRWVFTQQDGWLNFPCGFLIGMAVSLLMGGMAFFGLTAAMAMAAFSND